MVVMVMGCMMVMGRARRLVALFSPFIGGRSASASGSIRVGSSFPG